MAQALHLRTTVPDNYNLAFLREEATELWGPLFKSVNEVLDQAKQVVVILDFGFAPDAPVSLPAVQSLVAAHDHAKLSDGQRKAVIISQAADDVIDKIADGDFDPILGMNADEIETWYDGLSAGAKDTVARKVLVLLVAKLIKDRDFDVSTWVTP